jgi:hypothetical protein
MKTIDHLYSYKTYSGCLEGLPDPEHVYDGIRKQIEKLWGSREIHFIPPATKTIQMNMAWHIEQKEMLPRWTHIIWATGPEQDPENHGSELVIVWFTDTPIFNANDIVESVDWKNLAKDFQY